MDSIIDMMSEEERLECTNQKCVENSFSNREKYVNKGDKIVKVEKKLAMKDVEIIVENELTERGVELSNVSPIIEGDVVRIYGRIHLSDKFDMKNVLVIKAELLTEGDFIFNLVTDSMGSLITQDDDFFIYHHMISLEDDYKKLCKIRIFPVIYGTDDERW